MTKKSPSPDDCLCLSIRHLSRLVTQAYEVELGRAELTINQFSILRVLSAVRGEGMGLRKLAHILDTDPSTLTRNLRPLIRDGLVELRAGEDARARRAHLTSAGVTRLGKALPLWNAAQAKVAGELGSEASSTLLRLLSAARRL